MNRNELPQALQTLWEISRIHVVSVGLTASENTWTADCKSKIGGIAYLPENEIYPRNENGEPLALLFQLNFAEIAEQVDISQLRYELPKQGILQFFIEDDDSLGVEKHQIRFWNNVDLAQNEIELHKVVDDLKDIHENNGGKYWLPFNINRQLLMHFELSRQSTHFHCAEYQQFSAQIDELKDKGIYDYLDEFGDNLSTEYSKSYQYFAEVSSYNKHVILGYPEFTQEDPRYFVEYSDDPDLICYDDVEYNTSFPSYISLLQIDSHYNDDGGEDIIWGDCGIANFFIHPDDLKNADFSKMVYYWDCS